MEFTRIAYTATDGVTVRISNVQEPNSFGGWGYLVWTDQLTEGNLGLVETLNDAQEIAETYMREYTVSSR